MSIVEYAIVGAILAVVVVLVARIWRGDRRNDRGPFSSAMTTRGDMAALGGTIDEPDVQPPQGSTEHEPKD